MSNQAKSQGYVIHKGTVNGENFVVIATGFKKASNNRKTGEMIQTWILLEDVSPVEAMMSGNDALTVCQGCPFASGNGCYVNLGQAPLSIWKAYHRGIYPEMMPKDYVRLFSCRKVRFGAYGNPSLLPLSKVKAIAKASSGWTGYYHNWRDMTQTKRQAYNQFFMASTETESSRRLAEKLELRYFHVSPVQPEATVQCVSDSHGVQCADCKLCQGQAKKAKSIWINPHGSGSKKAATAATATATA